MHKAFNIPPKLPERAQEVSGWQVATFHREPGRTIRYGHAPLPNGRKPKAIAVVLQGLSEYMEKYFEVMNDLHDRDIEVWALDWMGQGGSGRYLKDNLDKRHISRFQDDIDDLGYLMENFVIPSTQAADGSSLPVVFLGHSMGGHMGLRYIAQHPDAVKCAGFSAPLTGILQVKFLPLPLLYSLEYMVSTLMPESYASKLQQDWHEGLRPKPPISIFSNDKKRNPVHNAWMKENPFLRIGGPTYKWVVEALNSCRSLRAEFSKIVTPCVVGLASRDLVVDNGATRALMASAPHINLVEIPRSCHEILMENNTKRSKFLNEFFMLLEENGINKPDNNLG
ncbi:MAG: alpha/beta hydrolase [Alphaproteobacteria bacterium]|nr:alpha/beta hydrolase [Alphaproteobacteria bacterium]MCD8525911.1 alpha/beta hydrolase [Alphaproteobacteria bacterium]MCD8570004.1 alpha/beta hydrolase [Alphaproteobacteria bacterium]